MRIAEKTDPLVRRAELLLAAANNLLARGLESACTRRFLRIGGGPPPDVGNNGAVRAMLDRADSLTEACEGNLQEFASRESAKPAHAESDAAADAERLSVRLDAFRAFGHALRVFLLEDGRSTADEDVEAARSARAAASALSPLLEDQDTRVSAAARLWQAVLRSGEADPIPTLSILGTATSDPREGSMPYAFFSRLLRCRVLAGRGGWAASLALLMQIEERCNEWFADEADRDSALRTCALVRIQVLSAWHESLPPDSAAEERNWCVEQIGRLRSEQLSGIDATVMRLSPAIPVLVAPPDVDAGPPDVVVDPATQD